MTSDRRHIGTVTTVHGAPVEIWQDHDGVLVGGFMFDRADLVPLMRDLSAAWDAATEWARERQDDEDEEDGNEA